MGAIVAWLETLRLGAGSCCRVVKSQTCFAIQRLENSLCQPSSKWVPFVESGKDKAAKGDSPGMDSAFSSAVPKVQWAFNPHSPYGYQTMETFPFYLINIITLTTLIALKVKVMNIF